MSEKITIPVDKANNYVMTLPMSAIQIGNRFRQDHGDIEALAASIKELGLLQPIGIDRGYSLIFGHRRFLAHQRLGLETIKARIIEVPSLIQAEHDENELRKSFTPSERVAIAEAIKAEIGNRQGQRTDKTKPVQNFAQVEPGQKTREAVAKAAGFGNAETYRQAKTVVEKADPALVEAMDKGKVSISTAAMLASAPTEIQRKAVAEPKTAPLLAKVAPVVIKPKAVISQYYTPEQWSALSEDERHYAFHVKRSEGSLNTQNNDSIDWAAYSWNPITGCNHDCPYCYARDIANRFYGELGFKPAFHPGRLHIPYSPPKSGSRNNRIFTCSMADLFGEWVPRDWIEAVLDVCDERPDFDFLLLTKNPKRLREFKFPPNCWVGTTTDSQRRMDVAEKIFADVDATVKWVSVEPMLEPIMPSNPASFDWYVIGGASRSSGQPGFVPPFLWVAELATAAIKAGSQVFIKTNFWQAGRPQGFPMRALALANEDKTKPATVSPVAGRMKRLPIANRGGPAR